MRSGELKQDSPRLSENRVGDSKRPRKLEFVGKILQRRQLHRESALELCRGVPLSTDPCCVQACEETTQGRLPQKGLNRTTLGAHTGPGSSDFHHLD